MHKRIRRYDTGEERGGSVGTILLGNDKNNFIVSYLCSKFLS